ncbi:L-asparaginase, thermolabile family protein [Roseobacter sp. SK209-2-6]|uniref:asparaginase n=1 Tax=Roseobacter sp. SK209-2-6 TaxID=388739 RepID=UPI0000F3D0F3|nr:asparaginase [Roseobacter sp. SK209-2-6]EBA17126.1 L-asparaginase, thermolabile family protein [Roseobacter sp. SK209-2-6]
MTKPVPMAEIWRGELLESLHLGHAVVCDEAGQIVRSWGDPKAVIYPRSSAKMIQALPLITSGAAAKYGLNSEQLALACASHNGAHIHTDRVNAWLDQLGLADADFRCGPQLPDDIPARNELIKTDSSPCQVHNNCSGKHAGFLTLSQFLGAGPEYIEMGHPVQQACLSAFEEATGENSPGYGIDGCSAPNFATTVHGLARAMSWFASAGGRSDRASQAAAQLTSAMATHPELVAGETRACTNLMRAMGGKVAIKTGAEAVFVAIIPEKKLGVALKVVDGATRASECAIASILVGLGVLEADHPATGKYMNVPILNRRKVNCGSVRPSAELLF